MRCLKTPFINSWENIPERKKMAQESLDSGRIPFPLGSEAKGLDPLPEGHSGKEWLARRPWLMGQCAGAIGKVQTAEEIIKEMVTGAVAQINRASAFVAKL